jgi:hypothetical protein
MLKKIKVTIESEKVVEVISGAKSALTEATLFYGFLKENDMVDRCREKEQKSIIEGAKYRLEKLGLSKEQIDSISWELDPKIELFYKDWCKDNNRDFTNLESMNLFLEQKGQQA